MRCPSRHFGTFFLAALVGLTGVAAGIAAPASADPITDKQNQAKALEDQIAASSEQVTQLGEQYDAAQLALDAATQKLAEIEREIAATKAQIAKIKALVRDRAAGVYRQRGTSGGSVSALDTANIEEFMRAQRYAAAQAERDNHLLDQLKELRARLGEQQRAAQQARDAADAQRQHIADAKAAVEAANAYEQQLLTQVKGEIAQLVQQEMQRRQAEALAAARGRYGIEVYPNLPPPGPSTAKAIDFAYQQLGKTYVYAAAGPDHYDCSGLVMAAFRSAGVSLPHYSGAMYDLLPHVPLSGVQRGDLIFWGAGGSKHVAIYLGDAQIIESGGSSHDVHVGPIWGTPSGAARITD